MNEDRFAAFLDALVAGNDAHEHEPPADIARRIQHLPHEPLDGEHRTAIWRSLMSAPALDMQATGGPGPLSQPALAAPDAFNPWVRRPLPQLPKRNRMGIIHEAMQTGITAMAIVAVVIAAFVAFPILRGDNASPSVTPTAWAAAPTVPNGGFGAPGSASTPDTHPTIVPSNVVNSGGDGKHSTSGGTRSDVGNTDETPTVLEPLETPWPTTVAGVDGDLPTQEPPASTPSAIYYHPRANGCSGEALTVDDVMAIVEGKSSDRIGTDSREEFQRPMKEDEYQSLTESHRSWMACHFNGTAFQMWALETDNMIRADFLRMNVPAYSETLVQEQIESFETDASSSIATGGFTWAPPTDTFIPMIASWNPDAAPMIDENGEVIVDVVWMNQDGDVWPGDTEVSVGLDLPLHWTYVWSESSGQWLLDSYGP